MKWLESMYIDDCGLKLKQLTISRKIGRLHCIFYSSPLTVETSDLTFITSVRYVQLLNKTENRKRKWFWKVLRARYYRYDVHRRNLIGETAYFLLIVLHHHHLESRASVQDVSELYLYWHLKIYMFWLKSEIMKFDYGRVMTVLGKA